MAQRPVFLPQFDGEALVRTEQIEFEWSPGMAVSQKQKSIAALHGAAQSKLKVTRFLEVSSKSTEPLGIALSAFNLMIRTPKRAYSVECAYQASKVFENGGPYRDLLDGSSLQAKRDPRLASSGQLTGFDFYGTTWELEPQTAFYDWLYINALKKQPNLVDQLKPFSGFTDIEFNPKRSVNCQAYAVALFMSLQTRGILEDATSTQDSFLATLRTAPVNNARQNELVQPSFDF